MKPPDLRSSEGSRRAAATGLEMTGFEKKKMLQNATLECSQQAPGYGPTRLVLDSVQQTGRLTPPAGDMLCVQMK
jgi:hypothetical protein